MTDTPVIKKQKLNNDDNSNKNNTLVQFDTDIFKKMMECPICLDYVNPKSISCNNGHFICNTCFNEYRKKTYRCFCKANFNTSKKS